MPSYAPLGAGYDPLAADPRSRIALQMIQSGMDTSPIKSWTQGAARVANSLVGSYELNKERESNKDAMAKIVSGVLGQGAGSAPSITPSTPQPPSIPSDAMSGAPMSQNAAPLSGGILASNPQTPVDASAPASVRYNNPGAQWPGPSADKFGATGAGVIGGGNQIAQFPDPVHGAAAQFDLLNRKYAGMPLGAAIQKWSGNNNPGPYAAAVSQATGLTPDTVLTPQLLQDPKVAIPLAKAMAKVETGRDYPMSDQQWQQAHSMALGGSAQPAQSAFPGNALAFNGQIMSDASPLSTAPQAPQGGMQPPTGQPNITNVATQPAQPSIGNAPQMKPILAAPSRASPSIPPQIAATIRSAVTSDSPQAQALGMQMLQKYMQPTQYGFSTLPDGTVVRNNPQTGAVEPVYQSNKPTFVPNAARDQFGNPVGGFVDPTTKKVTLIGNDGQPIQPGQTAAQGGVPGQNLPTGDAFLQTQPKPVADQVKALAEGRMAFPAGFALKSPYWQHMIQMVSQYDPNFDAINYNSRAKTRADFTSGKSATQINAMNTVIGHLQSLSDAGDKLNNFSFTPANYAVNAAESLMGDPRYKQFDTTKKAMVDELTRVWRGSGGSEGDIKTWSDQINAANSPEQLHGVIHQVGDLISSKINAMGEQYKQGMGTSKVPIQLITPQSAKVLDVLRQRAGVGAAPSSDNAASPVAATKTINGKTYVNQNGQWFEQ